MFNPPSRGLKTMYILNIYNIIIYLFKHKWFNYIKNETNQIKLFMRCTDEIQIAVNFLVSKVQ